MLISVLVIIFIVVCCIITIGTSLGEAAEDIFIFCTMSVAVIFMTGFIISAIAIENAEETHKIKTKNIEVFSVDEKLNIIAKHKEDVIVAKKGEYKITAEKSCIKTTISTKVTSLAYSFLIEDKEKKEIFINIDELDKTIEERR